MGITKTHNKIVVFCLLLNIFLVGCTSSSSSDTSGPLSSIGDAIKDIVNPDPSVSTAEKQIAEIQKKLNQEESYALTQSDIQFLQSQGLVTDGSEIKAWVK